MTSGSTYKELRRHYSNLTTSEKPNRLKNQQVFLDLRERRGHRQTSALKIGKSGKYRLE